MAVAFDTATDGGSSVSTSLTWSHTVSGVNTILLVGTQGDVSSTPTTTGITYNGVAMTKINSVQMPTDRILDLWYLMGAATGSHSIVASFTGPFCSGSSASYKGVRQDSLDASGINTASSGTTYTQSLTTVADNCWVAGFFGNSNRLTINSAGTTLRTNQTGVSGPALVDKNAAQTPPGSVTLGVQQSTSPVSSDWAGIMASLAPFNQGTAAFLLKMV